MCVNSHCGCGILYVMLMIVRYMIDKGHKVVRHTDQGVVCALCLDDGE